MQTTVAAVPVIFVIPLTVVATEVAAIAAIVAAAKRVVAIGNSVPPFS